MPGRDQDATARAVVLTTDDHMGGMMTMTLPVLPPHTQPADRPSFGPLRELAQLQQRMNQLFTAVLDGEPFGDPTGAWTPLADLTETDDAYLVEIELPGVDREDLTVEIAGAELRVSGQIVEKEKIGWLRHRTRRLGQFAYHTLLPGEVDTEHISANLADGVLTVRVPKTEAAKPRKITVNAA
jgi:HSP20 family protein